MKTERELPAVGLERCRKTLRVIRYELDRQRRWLHARAARLETVVGDVDLLVAALAEQPSFGVRRRRHLRRSGPVGPLARARASHQADGSWEIQLDTLAPFRLPAQPGRLFALLSEDGGRDVGDGLVGFKSAAYLLAKLHEAPEGTSSRARAGVLHGRRRLAQGIHDLRVRLAIAVVGGDRLVQMRRGVGWRIAVRRPVP